MNKLIKGEKVIAEIKIDDEYYPIFCAKSCEFSIEQDELETTSTESGSSREFTPGMASAMLSVNGITTMDNSENKVSVFYLMQQSVRQQLRDWRIYFEADNGDTQQATFRGMIKSTSISKEGFSYAQSSLNVRVSGNVNFEDIVIGPLTGFEVFADYWQTVSGDNFITGPSSGEYDGTNYTLTADDIILEVDVEGSGFDATTGTPTPGDNEFLFTTGPVRIVFPSDLIFDGSQRVYVLFKRAV